MIVGIAEGKLQDEDLVADIALSLDQSVARMREEPVSAHLTIEVELVVRGDAPALRAELAERAIERLISVGLAISWSAHFGGTGTTTGDTTVGGA
jgi:hypothetical protein